MITCVKKTAFVFQINGLNLQVFAEDETQARKQIIEDLQKAVQELQAVKAETKAS
jgi:hypothetical protein